MPLRQKLTGPPLTRAVTAEASVLDEESRRVRLSFSSEIEYLRASWFDDPWIEVLGHDEGECDLSRLGSGSAPLLWGHDSYSRGNNVGVIEKAWVENGRGYADVRFSARDDVASLFGDVRDGIVSNVSVGYQILERTLVKQNKEGPSEYRVTRWLPMEVSLVSVPADSSVGVGRSADEPARSYSWTDIGDNEMSDAQNQPAPPVDNSRQDGSAAPDVALVARSMADSAVKAERERCDAINQLVRAHDLGPDFAASQIASGADIETVRSAALTELAKKYPPSANVVTPGKDESEKVRDAAESWMLHRGGQQVDAAKLNGNEFRGMSLIDIARDCLRREGQNVRGLTAMEVAGLALRGGHLSTSNFPILLQNTMHKMLQAGYSALPDVWREFCAVGTLNDFRPHYRYRMGSFGNLSAVTERNEFQHGTLNDAERESITGATKGKLLNITRQMIVNDDLGGFLDLASKMGRAAARTVEADVFTLLASNPTMGDTGALFNSTAVTTAGGHANITAYGAPAVAIFDTVRQAMASQVDVGGNDYVSVKPSIWLGPVALGGAARVANESQYDIDQSSKTSFYPNKSRGLFDKIIDTPRLSGSLWYAFANPAIEPAIEVAFLNGQQSPLLEMQPGFEVDGVTWKVRLDYGVAAVGYRGAHKVV